ncbi:hypothetical protein O0I10_001308 [Lichtheimia ornata]|uniref:Uncharacterized protein n=1 Tax=Lichtheimia ornata TaxID=688661 RepID=A0AAD7Y3I4_9FUNG|nr:uncharacterized protein O0I10_001308 [Lichtheimia ornata]KAJ8663131.1 hypothetical protein O0I10_001308 [Lichtheimia ornata]
MGLPDSPHSSKGGLPPDKPISYANAATSSREIDRLISFSKHEPQPWGRAINQHALLFDLTQLKISETTFLTAARQAYPAKHTCGMVFRKVNRKLLAEVVFTSEKYRKRHHATPIQLPDNRTCAGNLPIPDEWEVVKIHLTNMPILPRQILTEAITKSTSQYGHILECGIYIDHGWFTGSGYVYLNRASTNAPLEPSATKSPPLPLEHTISVNLKNSEQEWVHKILNQDAITAKPSDTYVKIAPQKTLIM